MIMAEAQKKQTVKEAKEVVDRGLEKVSGGENPHCMTKWQCKKCKTINCMQFSKCTSCGEPGPY